MPNQPTLASLAEDLETLFTIRRQTAKEERDVIEQLLDHRLVTIGSSDGGAHLTTFCGADYPTRLLTQFVPDNLSLEHAVAKLTSGPADAIGLVDRGRILPGLAGDFVVFDPDRLGVGPIQLVRDLPAGAERLVFPAQGYHATIVNGAVAIQDGVATGALAGSVLRGGQSALSAL